MEEIMMSRLIKELEACAEMGMCKASLVSQVKNGDFDDDIKGSLTCMSTSDLADMVMDIAKLRNK